MDHSAAGDEEAVFAVLFYADPQIFGTVFSGLRIGSLDQNIVKCQLLIGNGVALGLPVERLIVLAILRIVGERRLRAGETLLHIDVHCAYGIRVLLQGVSLTCKSEVLLVVVGSSVILRETGFLDGLGNVLSIGISRVLRAAPSGNPVEASVIRSERSADTVDIVDITSCEDVVRIVDGAAVVDDDGIPLQCFVNKIRADTADIADALQLLPILDDSHLAAHVPFFTDLIEDIDIAESVLRLRLLVDREHDRDRPLFCQFGIDRITRQDTDIRVLRSLFAAVLCIFIGGAFLRCLHCIKLFS